MKKVAAETLDKVFDTIRSTKLDTVRALIDQSDISADEILVAVAILKNDGFIDVLLEENIITSRIEINSPGIKFFNDGGYTEVERLKRLNEEQLQAVKKSYTVSWINAGATFLISITVLIIQVMTYNREIRKDSREAEKEARESARQSQQSVRDSLYEKELLRLIQTAIDSAKS